MNADENRALYQDILTDEEGKNCEQFNKELVDPDGFDFLEEEDLCDYDGNVLDRV